MNKFLYYILVLALLASSTIATANQIPDIQASVHATEMPCQSMDEPCSPEIHNCCQWVALAANQAPPLLAAPSAIILPVQPQLVSAATSPPFKPPRQS
ncbi:hypothetical protein [Salinibius halmophilus]|uniref:hypothetical protein n=1 Tax=Salinibius halmophilus TaxID=1853216 RepID=UPI0013147DA9|nr:hypothetical protein [Salinibius halmophilus]